MQKNGAGTLVLAGENVNQQWQVNAGTLRVAHPAQLGDAVLNNNVLIGGGGRLQIAPGADTTEIVNTRGFQVAGVNNNVALVEIRQGLRVVQTGTGIFSTTNNTFRLTGGGELFLSRDSLLVSNNTGRTLSLEGGGTLASNNAAANAFALTGNATNTIRINGGTIRLDGDSGAVGQQAGVLALNGGGRIRLNSLATTNDVALTFTAATSLIRGN